MPRVRILATGGTIAGEAPSQTDESYRPGQVGVESLIGAVRDLGKLASVSGEQVAQIASQDMNDARWLQIAARVGALFAASEADGIVVTHGTDSMEETAYFLHLVVKSDRPVVLTGAMRPATSLSPDGPLNLYNAVAVAADPEARARGAIVVLNDDLHSARDVTKSHTSDVQAFVSPGPGLLGTATYGRIRYFRRPSRRHTTGSEFSTAGLASLPRVDILYAHAGHVARPGGGLRRARRARPGGGGHGQRQRDPRGRGGPRGGGPRREWRWCAAPGWSAATWAATWRWTTTGWGSWPPTSSTRRRRASS